MRGTDRRQGRLILVAAVTALTVLAAAVITGMTLINGENLRHRTSLENTYQRSVYTMTDTVGNLEVNLSKLMVAGSSVESYKLINDTLALAEIAEASLSQLPLPRESTQKTGKYFNQVADWCRSYMTAILVKKPTEAYLDQAETLYIAARNINENLRDMTEKLTDTPILSAVGDGRLLTLDLNLSFKDMEAHTVEYPELIYDGPFSDGKKTRYKALEGLENIGEAEAVGIATALFSLENPAVLGVTAGKLDLYEIQGTERGVDSTVSVSASGGRVICYNRYRRVRKAELDDKTAGEKAVAFAERLGYQSLKPVWYNDDRAVAYVNLAPVVNDVTYYTDLVKVKVALDDGEVLGLEATGYCMRHCVRALTPTISEKTAKSLVSKKLTVENVRLALIPDGETEAFCFEVHGGYKGLDYFVYVDAHDGHQVDVLRVVDSDQGALVM
jgi:germination protein YpeB